MSVKVKDLATSFGGAILGDGNVAVAALSAIDEATEKTLCPLFRKRLLDAAPVVPAAVLANRALSEFALSRGVAAALVFEEPELALGGLIERFYPRTVKSGEVDSRAVVHSSAVVHPTARIGPCAVIERDVTIGADTVIGPGAVICRETVIGDRVRIGPGAVIGHEGFGFVPTTEGPVKIRQVGRVVIEDDVEIGANACVDRGTLGATRIGRHTKIDNLVQVGHNVWVGENVLLAGQVGIAGSCTVESNAMLGGQAGIADHLTIGAGAKIAAKSGVTRNVKKNEIVAGYPAMTHGKWRKAMANLARGSIVTPDTEDP